MIENRCNKNERHNKDTRDMLTFGLNMVNILVHIHDP
jgi:hypothetical protein